MDPPLKPWAAPPPPPEPPADEPMVEDEPEVEDELPTQVASGAPDDDQPPGPPSGSTAWWHEHPECRCAYPGCPNEKVSKKKEKYCTRHGGGYRCTYPTCNKSAPNKLRLCIDHHPKYALLRRLERDPAFRKKYLLEVWELQGYRCADPFGLCPWRNCTERPTCNMLEVDHDWPKFRGGQCTKENAQVLCRCCHGEKTARDRLAARAA